MTTETAATALSLNEDAQQLIADFTSVVRDMVTNGMEIGKRLHKWTTSEAFKPSNGGFNSNGEGLVGILLVLQKAGINIPRHIAMYWLSEYMFKQGLKSVPCPHCTSTFASTSKMKKHVHKEHPETRKAAIWADAVNTTDVTVPIVEPILSAEPDITTALADISDSPAFETAEEIPVAEPLVQSDEKSHTKKLQELFNGTPITVQACTAKDGLKSCTGRFNLIGVTKSQIERFAEILERKDVSKELQGMC